MKTATIRLILIVSLLAAAGIILTQIFWVRRAYVLDEQIFEQRARAALQAAAHDVMLQQGNLPGDYYQAEKINPSYFVAETGVPVEQEVLKHYLSKHLTLQHLPASFEYMLYDCQKGAPSYHGFVAGPGQQQMPPSWQPAPLPGLHRSNYYVGVYFPDREQILISQHSPWIWSSLGLLAILGVLSYLLLVVFRQKQLSEVQKNFVSNMTHEFKTPLSAIQLSADVLKNPNIISQPQRLLNYATIISNESSQLASQVERLLEVGEQERKLKLEKSVFCWQELITSACQSFLQEWKDKSRMPQIKLHLPEEQITFYGDERQLRNVLNNLLDNAARYCRALPKIEITLRQQPKSIILAVKDNGIGIAREHQRLLFQKFYRVPNGKLHDYKGFGLGLNYVRLIVKGHEGQVHCDSQKGKGSIFTLSFPVKNPRHYERNQSTHPVGGR